MQLDRITQHPDHANAQPCSRSVRMPVKRVFEVVALYSVRKAML